MQVVHTPLAPEAIGPYSQALRVGNLVFLSGQIPLNPETMQLCSDDIQLQTKQVFDNLAAVCKAAGGNLASLVKVTIYLTDLNDFQFVNQIMLEYFTEPYPARVTIAANALPREAKIEVDGIMALSM